MTKKFNKKALRAFAEKVKAPEIVTSLFREVESEITRVAVFDIRRICNERLLTTALFKKQGCYAVVFTRKTGEVISIEIDTGKWFKQQHYQDATYGKGLAQINLSAIVDFFERSNSFDPNTLWRTEVEGFKGRISAKRSVENARKRSIETNAMFANLSPIPSNFKSWCRRDLSRIVFDTSDRHRGYCQYCEQDIDVADKLVQGRTYKCPHCHHSLEAVSSHSHKWVREKGYSLYSEMDGKIVIRHFVLRIWHDRSIKNDWYEYERDILDLTDNGYYMYIKDIKYGYSVWRNEKKYPNTFGTGDLQLWWNNEKLYPYSNFSLLSYKQKKIVLSEWNNEYRWEEALTYNSSGLELAQILNSAGYSKDLAHFAYSNFKSSTYINKAGTTPNTILMVDGNIAKLFKEKQFSGYELCRYNEFRSTSERKSPKAFIESLKCGPYIYGNFCRALKMTGATVAQVSSYFHHVYDRDQFSLWYDYIANYSKAAEMAQTPLIGKSWVFPPLKNIKQKHDEAVEWYMAEYKLHKKREKEMKEQQLKKFVAGLASLDKYRIDGMIAVLPHCHNDFIVEGNNQHNCVGGASYFDAMVASKSIIVFLRHKEEKSYCTCEFKLLADGNINLVQCRLAKNQAAPDNVRRAAEKYGKLLQKQLLHNRAAA